MNTLLSRSIAGLLIVSITGLSMMPAQADSSARTEARAQLILHGVNAADADPRVAALTDEEAAQLATGVGDLPAGGNPGVAFLAGAFALGAGVAIFVALLPFIVIGGIAVLAIKNSGKGNGVVAPTEDFGPQ